MSLLRLSNNPLDTPNSLFLRCLVTSFACPCTLFQILKGFWLLHLQTTTSWPVFLSFHSIEPLLQFRHQFLISNLAFNVIYFMFSQCHNLFDCQLFFCIAFSHFHFGVEIRHCSFLWRPLLQLNEKVKIFGYFTINGIVSLFCWEKHSASTSSSVVWVGTSKHSRDATIWGEK